MQRYFACGEYTLALRLPSELADLRAQMRIIKRSEAVLARESERRSLPQAFRGRRNTCVAPPYRGERRGVTQFLGFASEGEFDAVGG